MYFWKCWRDSRLGFYFYLSLFALAAASMAVLPVLRYSNEPGWYAVIPAAAADADSVWREKPWRPCFESASCCRWW